MTRLTSFSQEESVKYSISVRRMQMRYDDDDKLYLTTLTLSAEAGFHNGRVKKTLTEFYK